jgi:hypothetical protein
VTALIYKSCVHDCDRNNSLAEMYENIAQSFANLAMKDRKSSSLSAAVHMGLSNAAFKSAINNFSVCSLMMIVFSILKISYRCL